MLDNYINTKAKKLLKSIAEYCIKKNINANQITLIGFGFGVISFVLICLGYYYLGVLFIVINRAFDSLDGLIAKQTKLSDLGGYLDISLDFIFYISIPLAFVISDISQAFYGLLVVFGFFLNGTSFLASALFLEKYNHKSNLYNNKSFFYSLGIIEASESIILLCLALLIPHWFSYISLLLFVLCIITFLARFINTISVIQKLEKE